MRDYKDYLYPKIGNTQTVIASDYYTGLTDLYNNFAFAQIYL